MEMKGKYLVTVILLVGALSVGMCSNGWIRAHATYYGVNDSPASLGKESIIYHSFNTFVCYFKFFVYQKPFPLNNFISMYRRSLWV